MFKKTILSIVAIATLSTGAFALDLDKTDFRLVKEDVGLVAGAGFHFYNNDESKGGVPELTIGKAFGFDRYNEIVYIAVTTVDANSNYLVGVTATATPSSFPIITAGIEYVQSESTLDADVEHYNDAYATLQLTSNITNEYFSGVGAKIGLDSYRIEAINHYTIDKNLYVNGTIGRTMFTGSNKDFDNQSDFQISLAYNF